MLAMLTFIDSASLAHTPAATETGLGLGVGLADLTENINIFY